VAKGAAAELARSSRVRQAYLGQGSGAAPGAPMSPGPAPS